MALKISSSKERLVASSEAMAKACAYPRGRYQRGAHRARRAQAFGDGQKRLHRKRRTDLGKLQIFRYVAEIRHRRAAVVSVGGQRFLRFPLQAAHRGNIARGPQRPCRRLAGVGHGQPASRSRIFGYSNTRRFLSCIVIPLPGTTPDVVVRPTGGPIGLGRLGPAHAEFPHRLSLDGWEKASPGPAITGEGQCVPACTYCLLLPDGRQDTRLGLPREARGGAFVPCEIASAACCRMGGR